MRGNDAAIDADNSLTGMKTRGLPSYNKIVASLGGTSVAAGGAKTDSIGYSKDEAHRLFSECTMEAAIEKSGNTGDAFRGFVAAKGM